MFNWENAVKNLSPGNLFFNSRLTLESFDDKKLTLKRVATGKPVIVTRAMIEKTDSRLNDGEAILCRSISYTSAIEAVVIEMLGGVKKQTIDGKGHYTK